ncbi:hypothetical protein FKM82_018664 [Ascaphus truei]
MCRGSLLGPAPPSLSSSSSSSPGAVRSHTQCLTPAQLSAPLLIGALIIFYLHIGRPVCFYFKSQLSSDLPCTSSPLPAAHSSHPQAGLTNS